MRPFRTNLRDVPFVEGLSPREGWVNMQVQFLIDKKSANSDHLVLGWTVLPPGARHDRHRHFHADEFLLVLKGHGEIYTEEDNETTPPAIASIGPAIELADVDFPPDDVEMILAGNIYNRYVILGSMDI